MSSSMKGRGVVRAWRRRVVSPVSALGALVLAATGTESRQVASADAAIAAPPEASFQKVTLNGAPGEPIGLAVLPDGRVLHTTRGGRVFLHDPATGFNRVISTIPVYQHDEEGLQGIAVDPDFERNHWVYIYYSPVLDTPTDDPSTPALNEGDAPLVGSEADFARFRGVMRLSRFQLAGDELVLGSEQRILEVPVDRGICCHVGGQIDFDAQGNLYLSTGDDSNPFATEFTPIDERLDQNPAFDAQRSSANTNDLRGKLLRIHVNEDGSYSTPPGNLFPRGLPGARSEIYAMGLRNPFRFSVDRQRGVVYLADYSPDAIEPDPLRGPAGHGKWAIIRRPGNYGWPYCATRELPYVDYDFATGESKEPFDCGAPVNDSPRNTGMRRLPKVTQPEVWYGREPSIEFPELGTGGVAPMAGPAYHYQPGSSSLVQWPRYFDGVPIFYEWARNRLFEMRPNGSRGLGEVRPLLPSLVVANPIDMEFGPDGALYVLEYGPGYFSENPQAQLSRIDYVQGNFTPVPAVAAAPLFGQAPLTVQLSSAGTADPDGDAITLEWDFDADGVVDSTAANPSVTFEEVGLFAPTLRVIDATGRAATASARVVVGNTPPVVAFLAPVPGQPFEFGQSVRFEVGITDDQPVDCNRLLVEHAMVHDQHSHGLSTAQGCTGSFQTQPLDDGHAAAAFIAAGFRATYVDAPAEPGVPSLTTQVVVFLEPTSRPPLADAGAPADAAGVGVPDEPNPEQ